MEMQMLVRLHWKKLFQTHTIQFGLESMVRVVHYIDLVV